MCDLTDGGEETICCGMSPTHYIPKRRPAVGDGCAGGHDPHNKSLIRNKSVGGLVSRSLQCNLDLRLHGCFRLNVVC